MKSLVLPRLEPIHKLVETGDVFVLTGDDIKSCGQTGEFVRIRFLVLVECSPVPKRSRTSRYVPVKQLVFLNHSIECKQPAEGTPHEDSVRFRNAEFPFNKGNEFLLHKGIEFCRPPGLGNLIIVAGSIIPRSQGIDLRILSAPCNADDNEARNKAIII